MATYICPKCNVETADIKEHPKHRAERKRSFEMAILTGVGFSLFMFFCAGVMFTIFSSPPPDFEGGWLLLLGIWAIFGPLPVLAVGIWAITSGTKHKRLPEPTASLGRDQFAQGWTMILMLCVLFAISLNRVGLPRR